MLSLEQAQAAILAGIRPATATETVPLAHAHRRFLAADVRAQVDNPVFDNSAMDGYALRVADLGPHDFALPLAGESSCGDVLKSLVPDTTMRIFTGAPLPRGADAVAIQEDVQRRVDGYILFPTSARAGDHVRRRAEDFRAGEVLYRAGRQLRAYDLALLAAAGVSRVPVYARARALVLATGNELVEHDTELKPGQIYESTRVALLLQLEGLGVHALDGGIVGDEPAALRARLTPPEEFDFIITTGGASAGDHDLARQVFADLGDIKLWKARVKPGKPIAFGHIGTRTHFFALPGNPVSSLVTFKLFVEPALVTWHHGTPTQMTLAATAANDFKRAPGRTEFLRARLYAEGGNLRAEVLPGQGSHMLGALRASNGFIRVEAESPGFAAGDSVRVLPLARDFS